MNGALTTGQTEKEQRAEKRDRKKKSDNRYQTTVRQLGKVRDRNRETRPNFAQDSITSALKDTFKPKKT